MTYEELRAITHKRSNRRIELEKAFPLLACKAITELLNQEMGPPIQLRLITEEKDFHCPRCCLKNPYRV
jgi:hypothetical protein